MELIDIYTRSLYFSMLAPSLLDFRDGFIVPALHRVASLQEPSCICRD